MILTFFNNRINPSIPEYQKKVMDHFNVKIEQIIPNSWGTHAGEVDKYIASCNRNWEYLVLFDVDCIPLNDTIYVHSKILDKIESRTKSDRGIIHVESIVLNQNNEVVLTFERKVLVKKC